MNAAWILLLITALCVAPLALGMESIVLVGLPGGLPLGTLFAALAFISAAAVPVAASRFGTLHRRLSLVVLALAFVWLPIGIYLAENAALRFVNDAADSALFWRMTRVLAGLIVATMLWEGVAALITSRGKAGSKS